MSKIDLKKNYSVLFSQKKGIISKLEVPPLNYLMIDGQGDPNTALEFSEKVSHLYGVAYTLKFAIKKANAKLDFAVPPLEGLWWCDDMSVFIEGKKDRWQWTLLILQPDFVSEADVHSARLAYSGKKKLEAPPPVRLESYHEGHCVQALHIGPYSDETNLILSLHAHIHEKGWKLGGKHHEIYLSDPRRTAPAKMKTIIRQPYSE